MDLSNATLVADFGSGIGTEGSVLQIDTDNKRLGIGIDNPQAILQVGTGVTVYGNSGIVSATSFYGDASNITNTGSSLDAASGSQRVVVTSQTSGTMTAAATNGDLLFNASTNTLSAENIAIGGTLTYEDVTSVDSVGIITARTGLKVTAGGINAVGVVTATSFSGDGSNLSGIESGVENFVASGAIANGATVIIKDDGTVGIVTQTTVAASVGPTAVFTSGAMNNYTAATYIGGGKVVIAWRDNSTLDGIAIVGTVSGTSISYGTPVTFNSGNTGHMSLVYDPVNDKVWLGYEDGSNSNHGTARIGTVSGTSISFGTESVFWSAGTSNIASVYDTANSKIVISFSSGSMGYSLVITVSGTSFSYGSSGTFNTGYSYQVSSIYDPDTGKVVVAYKDGGNNFYGTARIGTVSGTSISFGSEVVFASENSLDIWMAYDTANDKVVIIFSQSNSPYYGKAIVGTVSGTSISFGNEEVFASHDVMHCTPVYDPDTGRVIVPYADQAAGFHGYVIEGTVSGTDITFGTSIEFENATTEAYAAVYDTTNNKTIIAYQDSGNSNAGTAIVYTSMTQSINLTTENYIGIAGEAIANAATGKINIQGGTNTGQSGLTTAKTYYVAPTGILTTTAGTPSVVAGTSISDTKILVR